MPHELHLINKESFLMPHELHLIVKESLLMPRELLMIVKESLLIPHELTFISKEALLITKELLPVVKEVTLMVHMTGFFSQSKSLLIQKPVLYLLLLLFSKNVIMFRLQNYGFKKGLSMT